MPKTATFYEAVQRSLVSEGFTERTIIRTFAPMEANEATEVLLLHHGKYPETAYVAPTGALIHGPCPGFGPHKGC